MKLKNLGGGAMGGLGKPDIYYYLLLKPGHGGGGYENSHFSWTSFIWIPPNNTFQGFL